MSEMEENKLVSVAMQIILHAGDARIKLTEALQEAKCFAFANADSLMQEAEEAITLAHKAQTDIIQDEASGGHYEFSLLFAHAQDTLMTVNSELRMAVEMISILKIINDKMK